MGSGYRGKVADIDLTLDAIRHARFFLPSLAKSFGSVNVRLGAEFWKSLFPTDASRPEGEPQPNAAIIRYNLEQFFECFPHLATIGIERTWAGQIDTTPDMIPIIGRVPAPPMCYSLRGSAVTASR